MERVQYIVRYVLAPGEVEHIAARLGIELPDHGKRDSKEPSANRSLRDPKGARVIRQHSRLFLKIWALGTALNGILKLRGSPHRVKSARLASSLAAVALAYRMVFQGLRSRFPNAPRALAPALAATLASIVFSSVPSAPIKGYAALYLATKVAEWFYNLMDDLGYMAWKPPLFGAWLLFPAAMSQLFWVLLDAPELCPASFKQVMLRLAGDLHPARPRAYPATEPWPSDDQWLKALVDIARLRFPRFRSGIVFQKADMLPQLLVSVQPILAGAHPGNTTLTGALMHPGSSSILKPFLSTVFTDFRTTGLALVPLYAIIALIRNRRNRQTGSSEPSDATSTQDASFYDFPGYNFVATVVSSIPPALRTAAFVAGTAATAWAGIGVSQRILGRSVRPELRFRLLGFIAGLWSFVDQVNGRPRFLYAVRLALLSQYNQIRAKRPQSRSLVGPDAELLFSGALILTFILFNCAPEAIASPSIRKMCEWIQCGEWRDPAPIEQVNV